MFFDHSALWKKHIVGELLMACLSISLIKEKVYNLSVDALQTVLKGVVQTN